MKQFISLLLVVMLIGISTAAYARDSECDCECTKGGIGIQFAGFVIGFGARTYNSTKGCDNNFGIGVGLGSETCGVQIGFGFNEGLLGFGITFKGSEKTRNFAFGFGYDYSDCRMVWPYKD